MSLGGFACSRGGQGGGSEPVTVSEDAICHRETEKAILVECVEVGRVWVPKSVVHDDSEVYKAETDGTLVVKRWFAEKEGWA